MKNHLVDKLVYKDELIRELKQKLGVSGKDNINYVSLEKYDNVPDLHKKIIDSRDRIAIIYALGSIGGGRRCASLGHVQCLSIDHNAANPR